MLPSYTALGMASLLPHHTLAYRTNSNLDVMADDAVVSTLEQRSAHLGKYQGLAVKADELLAMGKDKGREFVRDHRVIYVYHDRIDMLGDKQGSEGQTFDAVAQTLAELNQLASFIVNSLNGSLVLITADHGFLYQESALDGADNPHSVTSRQERYGRRSAICWGKGSARAARRGAATRPSRRGRRRVKAAWISGCPKALPAFTLPAAPVSFMAAPCRRRSSSR
ncbi:PglZ domain-containing protein [Candidatus Accumulibacter meliphilus]|uniref:PglZ domain-containing protein n=1 Tax=Candidatus Accumulibacter meliphilus TaxID=2211374 RepID=UPI003DA8E614